MVRGVQGGDAATTAAAKARGGAAVSDLDPLDRIAALHAEREGRRLWAAMMLARDVKTLESICLGLPVSRHRLDRKALLRAVRGAPLAATDWIWITPEMLDAVDEGGPFR